MKKILSLALCVLMLLASVACAAGGSSKAYAFKYNGSEISVDMEMSSALAALGRYDRQETSPSCNHDGDAHFYYYGTKLEVETYPKNGKDYVYKITLFDDTVATAEGVRIGNARDAVTEAYGNPTEEKGNALIYRAGNMYLRFHISNSGRVSQIQYLHPDAIA